jgi:hypothetical protein
MLNNRSIWLMLISTVLFLGAALFTLRAAERTGRPVVQHPAPAAPEESATISDDPTTAPDPAQSADNNVSFPNDI